MCERVFDISTKWSGGKSGCTCSAQEVGGIPSRGTPAIRSLCLWRHLYPIFFIFLDWYEVRRYWGMQWGMLSQKFQNLVRSLVQIAPLQKADDAMMCRPFQTCVTSLRPFQSSPRTLNILPIFQSPVGDYIIYSHYIIYANENKSGKYSASKDWEAAYTIRHIRLNL